MTNEALARNAVACKHWRWCPGMLPLVLDDEGDWVAGCRLDSYQEETRYPLPNALPDLDDPATLGCLLALVRRAWERPSLHVEHFWNDPVSFWRVLGPEKLVVGSGNTEAEALVSALEYANG